MFILKYITKILLCLLAFSALSCSVINEKNVKAPEWVFGNIKQKGICYVGSSRPHIKGIPNQRALAVSRAIEGIARQKNVTVDSRLEHYTSGTFQHITSSLNSYSIQTSSGENISAAIQKTWLDRKTGELYIFMCEE